MQELGGIILYKPALKSKYFSPDVKVIEDDIPVNGFTQEFILLFVPTFGMVKSYPVGFIN